MYETGCEQDRSVPTPLRPISSYPVGPHYLFLSRTSIILCSPGAVTCMYHLLDPFGQAGLIMLVQEVVSER